MTGVGWGRAERKERKGEVREGTQAKRGRTEERGPERGFDSGQLDSLRQALLLSLLALAGKLAMQRFPVQRANSVDRIFRKEARYGEQGAPLLRV